MMTPDTSYKMVAIPRDGDPRITHFQTEEFAVKSAELGKRREPTDDIMVYSPDGNLVRVF